MIKLMYDLHIHSVLSPCGHDDMTPFNIISMAALKELDVIALTDHNSCKNCPPFLKHAKDAGIIGIPGMELCTQEEVHVLILFYNLESAMLFDEYVEKRLIPIKNKEEIFGSQIIMNEMDIEVGKVDNLLINATTISFFEVYDLAKKFQGVMIPAHVDKMSHSIISNLGFVPTDSKFTTFEMKDKDNLENILNKHVYLRDCNVLINSDAHYLEDINEPIHSINTWGKSIKEVLELFNRTL
jgi:PHP family Zn ribbon phosphoesterase